MDREKKTWETFLTVFPHISGGRATGGEEEERNQKTEKERGVR